MPYITVKQSPAVHQLTLEEILAGPVDLSKFTIAHHESNTRTYCSTNIPPSLSHVASPETLISLLEQFVADHQALYQQDRSQLYTTFHIPKKSGGLREINAPVPELMHALRVSSLRIKKQGEVKNFCRSHPAGPRRIGLAQSSGKSTLPTKE